MASSVVHDKGTDVQEAIRSHAARLMLAEASLGFGVAVMHGIRFAWANPAYCEIVGHSLEELLAIENGLQIIAPEELPRMAELQGRFLRGEKLPTSFETRLVHKDGHVIDVEAAVQMLSAPEPGVLFCVRDIGETKRLNRELSEKDRILEEAQRITGTGTYVWDVEKGTFAANGKLFEVWGLPRDADFATLMRQVHPDDVAALEASTQRVMDSGAPDVVEYRIMRADGVLRRVRRTAVLERDATGKGIRVIGAVQDITSEYEGLLASRMVKQLFEEAFEGTLTPVQQRRYGHALAAGAKVNDLPSLLHSYAALGMGTLGIAEEQDGRYVFRSEDLTGSGHRARTVGCHMALGFLEGAVTQAVQKRALGTETRCRRRGDPACEFVVSAR